MHAVSTFLASPKKKMTKGDLSHWKSHLGRLTQMGGNRYVEEGKKYTVVPCTRPDQSD